MIGDLPTVLRFIVKVEVVSDRQPMRFVAKELAGAGTVTQDIVQMVDYVGSHWSLRTNTCV